MELDVKIQGEISQIRLPHTLSISDAAAMRDALLSIVDTRPTRVIVDLDQVAVVDTASLQLLASLMKTVTENGGQVQWENLSVALYMAACQLNLEEYLQL